MTSLRNIPSIDALLQRPGVDLLVRTHGRQATIDALRTAAAGWRQTPAGDAATVIETEASGLLTAAAVPSLRRVLNATGVIIHTNLGRAPLARAALEHAAEVARGYSNLEYDLDAGARGHRHVHAERLLCRLTGAEAAAVTNNNAAATMLVLAALAAGREVLVSRGELVEIGGGFRVPDILSQSGADLREVGTTNRTRISDYAAAISDRTGLILRVHPSNFRIDGFSERPTPAELVALGRRFSLPVFEDLGSGWLGLPGDQPWPDALAGEPSVREAVAAGIDVVAFSGDKLLGGPQAGLIVGTAALVDRVRRHPLMRAVRADKQSYAALEATLALWQTEPRRLEIPLVQMLTTSVAELDRRACALAARLVPDLQAQVVDGFSTIGGGSAPGSSLPTRLVALKPANQSAASLEGALRAGRPSVVARIQDDSVLVDVRTIAPGDDDVLAQLLNRAAVVRR